MKAAPVLMKEQISTSCQANTWFLPFFRGAQGEAAEVCRRGECPQAWFHQGCPAQQAGGADPVPGQRLESSHGAGRRSL